MEKSRYAEAMVLTLELPDSIAHALTRDGGRDLSRQALEALALEGYRQSKLTSIKSLSFWGCPEFRPRIFWPRI